MANSFDFPEGDTPSIGGLPRLPHFLKNDQFGNYGSHPMNRVSLGSHPFSAFGTAHPVDIALGKSRMAKSWKEAAKSPVSHGDIFKASFEMARPQMAMPREA